MREVDNEVGFEAPWVYPHVDINNGPIHVDLKWGGFRNTADRVANPIQTNAQISNDTTINWRMSEHLLIASRDIQGKNNGFSPGCYSYTERGITEWRLPTMRELQLIYTLNSIIMLKLTEFIPVGYTDHSMKTPVTDYNGLYGTINGNMQSASEYAAIDLKTGAFNNTSKNVPLNIRCVKDLKTNPNPSRRKSRTTRR